MTALRASASKAEFLQKLGLNEENAQDLSKWQELWVSEMPLFVNSSLFHSGSADGNSAGSRLPISRLAE